MPRIHKERTNISIRPISKKTTTHHQDIKTNPKNKPM